jgi:hypothetical protein
MEDEYPRPLVIEAETPSAHQWLAAMRAQFSASDSYIAQRNFIFNNGDVEACRRLIRAGEYDFLRRLPIRVDITAPAEWWRELNAYVDNVYIVNGTLIMEYRAARIMYHALRRDIPLSDEWWQIFKWLESVEHSWLITDEEGL